MIDRTKPLTEQTASDLRALIDALRGNRESYRLADRRVEVRSCDLEIAEATRALAIVNRRATEAEDQRQAEERTAAATLRGIRNALLGWRDDVDAAHLDNGWQIAERIDTILKLAPSIDAQPALTADEVRAVVREAAVALLDERKLYIVKPQPPTMNEIALEVYGHGRACDAVALQGDDLQAVLADLATRVAEKLAGRAGPSLDTPTVGDEDDAAAEYSRGKAGG